MQMATYDLTLTDGQLIYPGEFPRDHLISGVRFTVPPDAFLDYVGSYQIPVVEGKSRGHKKYYANVPICLDTECTSFEYKGRKAAVCYMVQVGLGNVVTFLRNIFMLPQFLHEMCERMQCHEDVMRVIWVHNLPYDSSFFHKLFSWDDVFFLDKGRPLYMQTGNIIFRDSMALSGNRSLATIAKELGLPSQKQTGLLDYSKIRFPDTPLTFDEIKYSVYDVYCLLEYIQTKIEQDGNIGYIPNTNTGYVRNSVKEYCRKAGKSYFRKLRRLIMSPENFRMLRGAFQGGAVHANAMYVGKTLERVRSRDFASSYPARIVKDYFPMSQFHDYEGELSFEALAYLMQNYSCLVEVGFEGLVPLPTAYENSISYSKCSVHENCVTNNGRVVSASLVVTTLTELDFQTVLDLYDFENMKIYNIQYAVRGRMPKPIVQAVLEYYSKKTTLKDVVGMALEYMISKNMLNSVYGMMVTNPIRELYNYSNSEFCVSVPRTKEEMDKALETYNNGKGRFLYYAWGVWITAHARRALYRAIVMLGKFYVYCDTDSTKYLDPYNEFDEWFENEDKKLMDELRESARYYHIDIDKYMPKNPDGKTCSLGIWEDEGTYDRFKTLGAKRYIVEVNGDVRVTLSGVNKAAVAEYISKQSDPFAAFSHGTKLPAEACKRNFATRIEYEVEGVATDYLGNECYFHALSGYHLAPEDYEISLSRDFIKYLDQIGNRVYGGIQYG